MHFRKYLVFFTVLFLFFLFSVQSALAWDGSLLKKGMSDSQISQLQQDLKDLGYFQTNPTGYFGSITQDAVSRFQADNNLTIDGIVGKQTYGEIARLLNRGEVTSRSAAPKSSVEKLPWFGEAENIFSIGSIAKVTDIITGDTFLVKRTYGYNHADVETLTVDDTDVLKLDAGGYFNWVRRPILVEVNGHRIAASMAPMPHAGRDDMPANINVPDRSEGYGWGENLDMIKGNNMDGHFDIHFYQSRTHGTNSVNADHQAAVQKAYEWGFTH